MTKTRDDKPYTPIACDRYSEYEQAIMHRQTLRLRWHADNVIYKKNVLPMDLKTEHHEEYLICRDETGIVYTVRLDHIDEMEPA